ncbi:oligosaccharide flippase family protein [Mariniblastus fucicola]|uniref:Polysaccharide biosynthesis protein n=1 Tax=Mariniblastus fucicola TaxID=980251 RepID=A0A5B9PJT2_9BACT|nr:oligosaccharide flippase family protein [Mariniblastus fucicola]QEG22763.1 Polysaccharide biosynthesis protein [Mariniblastus fucicola]
MATGSKAPLSTTALLNDNDAETTSPRSTLVTDSIATGVLFALVLTVGQRGIGFLRGLLFCRYMSDQQLGQWSLVWSFLMMLIPLAMLGLPGCFGRYTEHYRSRGQLGYFLRRITIASTVLTLVASVAMFVFPQSFARMIFRTPDQTMVIYAMAASVLMVSVSNFLASLMESLRQVRVLTLMRFITGILFATLGVGLVLLMENATVGATIGFGISSLIGAIPAMWILLRHREAVKNTGEYLTHSTMWRRLAPFALWMWASNFFNNCFELSDRYMLLYCSPVSADLAQGLVGQYHSGRQIPLLLVSLSFMLGGVLIPYMSAHWEQGRKEAACKQLMWALKLMCLAFTIVGIGIQIFAPFIFETILEGRYDGGLAVLPLTLVYCIWFGLTSVAQNYLWVVEKGKWIALSVGLGLAINLILNWLLIPHLGVNGAVIATATSNGLLLATIYVFNKFAGCRMDASIWYCSLFPLILLMPTYLAIGLALLFAFAGWKTQVVFRDAEKSEIVQLGSAALRKFGIGSAH